MRFAHISDLHLGRRLGGFSLYEDQKHILSQIKDIAENNRCDGIIIAGDIYDKSSPSSEAVGLFDDFLTELSRTDMQVFIISGNHDSAERVAYGGRIMESANIYISSAFEGSLKKVTVNDDFGELDIYMLPFIKPSYIKHFFPDDEINDYTDMIKVILKNADIDYSRRNILMLHQFITGAKTCDSEYISVGTLDNIEAAAIEAFDYAALGHIHGAQYIRDNIRYCGTPLKYSVSEASHEKSVTIVELREKGSVSVDTVPFEPLRDLRELKGSYSYLMDSAFHSSDNNEDYLHVTLTDNEDIPNVLQKLRMVYPNIIQLDYDNKRTQKLSEVRAVRHTDSKTPMELFEGLYSEQNGEQLSEEQRSYMAALIEEIWGDGE